MNRQQRRAANRKLAPLTEAEMHMVGEDAENNGCSRCGNFFAQGLPYLVVRTNNEIKPRCTVCGDYQAQLLGMGLYFGGGDPWAADDRAWFETHATRSYRLRAPWKGEIDSMAMTYPEGCANGIAFLKTVKEHGYRLAVIVRQLEPGKRFRSLAGVPGDEPFDSYTDAGIKHFLPGADKLGGGISDPEAVFKDQIERRMRVTEHTLREARLIPGEI